MDINNAEKKGGNQEKSPYRYDRILWITLIVVEAMLALRFCLKFIGFDKDSGFSGLIYKITYPLVSPFLKALGTYKEEGSVFEWTTLAAMLLYLMVTWIIIRIFLTDNTVASPESEKKYK